MVKVKTDQPRKLQRKVAGVKGKIKELQLPVVSFLAVHTNGRAGFDAVEMDQYRRVYVYEGVKQELIAWIRQKQQKEGKKFVAVGLGNRHKHTALASKLWLLEDIVPHFIAQTSHNGVADLIQSVRLTAAIFTPELAVQPIVNQYNQVEPSYLVEKKDYQKTASLNEWKQLEKLARKWGERHLRFISATPQGGGVALMRQAMIRLYRLLGLRVSWYVLYDDPDVFTVTKTKFHNVLQGVAPEGVRLTTSDKARFLKWSRFNSRQLKPVIDNSDVVVIDDPQPAGLIPEIIKINPQVRLIYRSHIQIESHLIDQAGSPQEDTWQFIGGLIKAAEVFVAHPIPQFVPSSIDNRIVVTMPAVTDPLDGLNKRLSREQNQFYMGLFNKYLIDSGQQPLDMARDYIIQIARFDPSKGIPDLLEAYRLLCERLPQRRRPQLVVVGHGSVDDPDGIPILNHVTEMVNEKRFELIKDDIKIARLPHVDQPLDALLGNAKVALQLSHKEGFEVKVTEALMKGVPMVAYRTGGIPLQVDDGVNGWLVEVGKVEEVAKRLYQLMTDKKMYQKMRLAAKNGDYSRYQTVANASRWLWLANELVEKGKVEGNGESVDELMRE